MARRKTTKSDFKELTVKISSVKFTVDVNPMMYDDAEYNRICEIVDHMSREIWIDKTYVKFNGSMWRDAFIVEDKWYELLETIRPQIAGKKISEADIELISLSWAVVVITYMYSILEKYGYSVDDIDLSLDEGQKMHVVYFEDKRTKWEM